MVACVPYQATFEIVFKHAGQEHLDTIQFGWFKIRLPGTERDLWIRVANDQTMNRQLVLITNIPLISIKMAQEVYNDWRLRTRIEHGYRFDQEQGLDVEDLRVHTVERMRRLFAMVLLAAQIVLSFLSVGRRKRSCGYASWAANSIILVIAMAPIGFCEVWLLSLQLACHYRLLFLHPFPFQEFTCG